MSQMTTKEMDEVEKAAILSISQARSGLLLQAFEPGFIFFSALAMQLRVVTSRDISTACTDGKELRINPEFILSLTKPQIRFLVVHEVLHVALLHHVRLGNRDPKRFNVAADLCINTICLEARLELIPGCCVAGRAPFEKFPTGLTAEQYYDMLPEMSKGAPCNSPGEFSQPGDGSASALSEAEGLAKIAVSQAQGLAKQKGNLPAGIARLIGDILQPKKNYKEILREFISEFSKNDSSWRRPNKRFVHQNIYLPSAYSEELGNIAIAIDTSGSIGAAELQVFASELEAILGAYSCKASIIYHDTKVYNEHRWESSDGPLVLNPKGGGGTNHFCVLDWVEKHEKEFVCLVCLTDLYTAMPDTPPEIPILWVVYGNYKPQAKYGQIVSL